MKLGLVAILAFLAAEPAETAVSKAARESSRRVLELAKQYEFFGDSPLKQKLDLDPRPLLVYSNPVRGDVYGNVFVWTLHGRPGVIGAFFDFRSEGKLDSELHMLAHPGTVGRRDGATFWSPEKPGVEFQPLPNAPPPAQTPVARLRQMKDFAQRFRVERNHPEQGKGAVRLLPQPIYRYTPQSDDIHDGAIFAFVEGTDPETFLLMDASPPEKPVWRFALSRMNIVPFQAFYEDKPVWSVDDISWDTVFDKQEPYAIIRETPRRGLKRTK